MARSATVDSTHAGEPIGRPVSGSGIPRAARRVGSDWAALTAPANTPAAFDPDSVSGLPEPVRRWLAHSLPPGTPLWRSVELRMHGSIRLGAWRSFTATQVLAPPDGFIWAATARFFGLPVLGYDRYSQHVGEMRWRLLGLVPVMTATGCDVTRSAAGRLAGEGVLLPTSYASAEWTPGSAPNTAVATWHINGESETVELRIGVEGALREVRLQRWGNPNGAAYGRYPFGVLVEEEDTFEGITIPSLICAGWWWGTDRQSEGEFFRARITSAVFR